MCVHSLFECPANKGLISLDHCKCVPGRRKRMHAPGRRTRTHAPGRKMDNVNALLVPGRRALMIKLPRFNIPINIVNKIAGYDI